VSDWHLHRPETVHVGDRERPAAPAAHTAHAQSDCLSVTLAPFYSGTRGYRTARSQGDARADTTHANAALDCAPRRCDGRESLDSPPPSTHTTPLRITPLCISVSPSQHTLGPRASPLSPCAHRDAPARSTRRQQTTTPTPTHAHMRSRAKRHAPTCRLRSHPTPPHAHGPRASRHSPPSLRVRAHAPPQQRRAAEGCNACSGTGTDQRHAACRWHLTATLR